jgi:hypothetical protein
VLVRQFLAAVLSLVVANVTRAQQHIHAACDPLRGCLAAQATGVLTHLRAEGGRTFTEAYLSQPFIAGSISARGGRLQALGVYNFEGYTLRRGELSPGTWGEGYVDRRHPHTHVHELMVGTEGTLGVARLSLFAGKGFVPFGSDDPMMRPFVRYPANHHLAQILERAQVVGAARVGPVGLEAAALGGDEPEGATDWPNHDRLFDSWSARATLYAPFALEAGMSVARLKSPEFAEGFGLNQNKFSATVRYLVGMAW